MTKIKAIFKTIFFSLILVICIISYVAYRFPDLFPICFHLSNFVAIYLALILSMLILSHNPFYFSIMRLLMTIVFLFIWFVIVGIFLWFYPLASISDPIYCFITVWGIAALTFSLFILIFFTFRRKKSEKKY